MTGGLWEISSLEPRLSLLGKWSCNFSQLPSVTRSNTTLTAYSLAPSVPILLSWWPTSIGILSPRKTWSSQLVVNRMFGKWKSFWMKMICKLTQLMARRQCTLTLPHTMNLINSPPSYWTMEVLHNSKHFCFTFFFITWCSNIQGVVIYFSFSSFALLYPTQ